MRVLLPFAAAAALLAGPASATVWFSDDFSGDTPALAVTSLPNFTITGTVDVVGKSNPYGIVTPKNVVDLDGTPGPGSLMTSASYSFGANQHVQLSFVLGGAQRGQPSNTFFGGFDFTTPQTLSNYYLGGTFGKADLTTFKNVGGITTSTAIAGTAPFTIYTLGFTSTTAGTVDARIGTSDAGYVGPLLSKVTIGAVPEPAAWAMLVVGFGLVGLTRRRMRSVAA